MSVDSNSVKLEGTEKTEITPVAANKFYCPEVDTSGVDKRKLLKIDWNVVPWLTFLYLLNFLDRGSIRNARVRLGSFIIQ